MASVTRVGAPAVTREPAQELQRGDVLGGRYQIEAVIGSGASGQVLRAFDRVTESAVALKILRQEYARDPDLVARFSRELRVGRRIQHPNVCRVFDIDEGDGYVFLTMELATRGTVRDDLRASAPPRAFADRVADAEAVIRGVAALHAAGIIHRDIKPENILRMADGRLVVSDFGLATNPDAPALTVMVGTPKYMAPEMVMGDPATTRSDVWALGVVVHEVLFSSRPEWTGAGSARRFKFPPAAQARGIERRLAAFCSQCASEDPANRMPNAGEMMRVWQRAVAGSAALSPRSRRRTIRGLAWLTTACAAASLLALLKTHFWSAASASSLSAITAMDSAAQLIGTAGALPVTGSEARTLASFPGRVPCLAIVNDGKSAVARISRPRGMFEDVDLSTGERRQWSAALDPEPEGCPDWSPNGQQMVFEAASATGPRIWVADVQGSRRSEIVRGSGPVWIGPNEFAYDIDDVHVAFFSLDTMGTRLLGTPSPELKKEIADKTFDWSTRRLVVRYMLLVGGDGLFVTYGAGATTPEAVVRLPRAAIKAWPNENGMAVVKTAADGDDLLNLTADVQHVRRLLTTPGREIALVQGMRQHLAFTTRVVQSSIFVGTERQRPLAVLPYPVANPVLGARGDVLLQSFRGDSVGVTLLDGRTGAARELTPRSVRASRPVFDRTGHGFLFTDVQRSTIVRCELAAPEKCRDVMHTATISVAPTESPDGLRLAYLTFAGAPRLTVVHGPSTTQDLGAVRSECTPIWDGANSIWVLRGTDQAARWERINVETGASEVSVPARQTAADGRECGSSPFADKAVVRVHREEPTDLRVVRL